MFFVLEEQVAGGSCCEKQRCKAPFIHVCDWNYPVEIFVDHFPEFCISTYLV